ncbi:MAG: helix-turn-helix domain-containing protein [Candidatus Riflebacteria bacterium]|nr:helix-turn-helix domain-containing protein [Candidatus Riflebacteria bacterium]
MEKNIILTLIEVAEKLRVSKHTIQAWMSPSSPNHRPDFAAMARHAGRKTIFLDNDIDTWLEQRKGTTYYEDYSEVSAYWREKFIKGRGLLKGFVKAPEIKNVESNVFFTAGKLGLDLDALLVWLTDAPAADRIFQTVNRAEYVILPIILSHFLLSKSQKNTVFYLKLKDFLLVQNIFVQAPFNEAVLQMIIDHNLPANDFSVQLYCSCIVGKSDYFLTANNYLLEQNGFNTVPI